MSDRARGWMWLLLSGILFGCAAGPHAVKQGEDECEQAPASFEEVCQQEGSLLAVCEGQHCAVYRCWEVANALQVGQVQVGQVVLTRGVSRPPLPRPLPNPPTRQEVGTPSSGPRGLPQPVLLIPWHGAAPALLPPGRVQVLEAQEPLRGKPYEKHHIYTQELKWWFEQKGIDIHQWTLALEVEEHRRIHRGASGGPWNEAWRRFQKANRDATKLEIELHAGKLIYEFNLYGVVVPYSRQLLRLPSNLLELD